ncbi:hypothetical protein PanWU01x14_212680 [Parasponia andersonii]|uniref:Uncharacterized protein n=1 Tax=Parasponia andersonii TaxID=3476 RepID=A0A2P5BSW2_PARAD|nr:hypothetical protein PanWU01x14_212680 [Parasponia andersonii]
MAFKSSGAIVFPLFSFLSSRKVWIPRRVRALYKWSVKLCLVSSPLKLRNTSNLHRRRPELEDDEDDDDDGAATSVAIFLKISEDRIAIKQRF